MVVPPQQGNVAICDGVIATQATTVKAANTPPTLADFPVVTAISPANSGLPVNIPTIVQQAHNVSAASTQTIAQAFGKANVPGNTIIVLAGAGNNGTLSVADTDGNTYNSVPAAANSTTFESQIFFCSGVLGNPNNTANTITVTNAGAAASMAVQIYETNGLLAVASAQPEFSSGGTAGSGTTASSDALAPSVPNALAFLAVAVGTTAEAVTAVANTPWVVDSSQNSGGTPSGLLSFGALHAFLPGIGSIVPQATIAGSKPWAAAAAVFIPVSIPVRGIMRPARWKRTNITTAATTLIKTGSGTLHGIMVNTAPASGGTLEYDDAVTNTNSQGIITSPGVGFLGPMDLAFDTGLSITTATHAGDYTILWD